MPTSVTIRDESLGQDAIAESTIELLTERVTVDELIRSRVYQEAKDYNAKQPERFRGLVKPTEAEQTLNGYKLRAGRQIDWKKQYDAAVEAFKRNQIVILVDDRQVQGLDEQIVVQPETQVTFLKLVLLVGG